MAHLEVVFGDKITRGSKETVKILWHSKYRCDNVLSPGCDPNFYLETP